QHRLVACADLSLGLAEGLAAEHSGCVAVGDYREAVARPNVDAVIVATTNNVLAPAALAAVEAGKHVLVEKPAARNAAELRPLLDAAEHQGVVVKVGFNHRFHPAFQKSREIFDSGALGTLLYIRARYGHGGRPGYDREWRADPEI